MLVLTNTAALGVKPNRANLRTFVTEVPRANHHLLFIIKQLHVAVCITKAQTRQERMTAQTEHRAIRLATDHLHIGARLCDKSQGCIGCTDQKVLAEELLVLDGGIVLNLLDIEDHVVVFGGLGKRERIDRTHIEVFVPHDHVELLVNESNVAFRVTNGNHVVHSSQNVY